MAASSKAQVLSLYRMLIKESKKFPSYNYRTYALRRVRDAFRENHKVDDPKVQEQLIRKAWDTLALIQRQVSIGQMYQAQQTVVEDGPMKTR
ncbi:LYR motif-containing protein 4 isoform X1 [Denticeps clupeoides]|uniref:LYR motif containing 4 n=1 Tax=Denticeps clupeoides TaxID=299321 RepID=A0AAY4D892_9TELE|nr:LYR motif-containing protein 4A-like isoform X1 [Denticeps clupeoides]